ncbi:NUDIX hydrolase [Bacillus sp. FJAT-49736]|uniref:NUDIX hydrolase n=1 Tax=Bacillus sp. FJAT-49736 TaxID=2833582 RepID=UPI001BC9D777|nr:NUDIX hydrolase [Bacillus sp. FJAT-49736]MBS4174375.1 NUDIX hydrolase [Bacillus sp. FJAT-49736]
MKINSGMVVVVSVSVMKDGKILLVQENKEHVRKKWGFPSGRMELGEDICYAACREAKEETGYDIQLTSTTGVYNFISSFNHQVIMFHFTGVITGGSLGYNPAEILNAHWVTLEEIKNMDTNDVRDPHVVQEILQRLEKVETYPIDIFKRFLGE